MLKNSSTDRTPKFTPPEWPTYYFNDPLYEIIANFYNYTDLGLTIVELLGKLAPAGSLMSDIGSFSSSVGGPYSLIALGVSIGYNRSLVEQGKMSKDEFEWRTNFSIFSTGAGYIHPGLALFFGGSELYADFMIKYNIDLRKSPMYGLPNLKR